MATPDLSGEAEGLVRALAGVTFARIESSDDGIEAIHVTARDPDVARNLAGHVRSALLAGLGTPVLPGRIHVRVDAPHPDPTPPTAPEPTSPPASPEREPGRHRIRLLQDERPPHSDGPETPDPRRPADPALHAVGATVENPPVIGRPRLVAVDVERPGDGRVLCRVAVAYHTRVHRAEAVAVDLPGAAAQAAAQAAVRALIDAGIPDLELHGLREVEIAGREYVLVALRQRDTFPRTRSGSVPIVGSPERSAAEATVAAANMIV